MKLAVDLHIHSVGSGHAYSTITEIAAAASRKGLELVAITDHGPAMPGAPHPYYFGNLRVLPESIKGVKVLRGIEANIIREDGTLDLAENYLAKLDVILAGFHPDCFAPSAVEIHTSTILNTLRNPFVDIICHPGNPMFPLDYEKVVFSAAKEGVALEINNSSLCGSRKGSAEHCLHIAKLVAQSGGPVFVGSDAHWAEAVGGFGDALLLLEKAGVTEGQVMNTSAEKVLNYLAGRRLRRQGVRQ